MRQWQQQFANTIGNITIERKGFYLPFDRIEYDFPFVSLTLKSMLLLSLPLYWVSLSAVEIIIRC